MRLTKDLKMDESIEQMRSSQIRESMGKSLQMKQGELMRGSTLDPVVETSKEGTMVSA